MDCDSVTETFLSKFDIKGKPLYAKIEWKNTKCTIFHLQVFFEELSWSGELSYEMSLTFGSQFDENDEQYSNNVRDALKIKNDMYIYDFQPVEGDSNVRKFYWKRRFVDTKATLVHGCVSVKKDKIAGTKNDIIDFLIKENVSLCNAVQDYKNKTEFLKNDLEIWKTEFEKFVDMKNSLETSLYGKFVQLLNSKKIRIQELEQHLNDL